MDKLYSECQNNVNNLEKKIRNDLDKQLEKNKHEAKIATNYLFNLIISDKIFKNKIQKASRNGKKREIIYKYSITDRIFIPELLRSFNTDTLLMGTKGPDIGTIVRFGIDPVFNRLEEHIKPFKARIIKEDATKYLEISW